MYNATSVSAVKYGDTVLAAKDYTFAEGTLTIKGSFLKTIAYDDMMTFVVTADGVEVKINVKAAFGGRSRKIVCRLHGRGRREV